MTSKFMNLLVIVQDVPRKWQPVRILFRPDDFSEFYEVGTVAGRKNGGDDSLNSEFEFGDSVATLAIVKEHKGEVAVIEVPVSFDPDVKHFRPITIHMNRFGAFQHVELMPGPSKPTRTIGVITPLPSFGDD